MSKGPEHFLRFYSGSPTGRLRELTTITGSFYVGKQMSENLPRRVFIEHDLNQIEARVLANLSTTDALDQECLPYNEDTMKNYDYFHSQNREQQFPGYANITTVQRGSKLELTATGCQGAWGGDSRTSTFDRNDYDCDAQFKAEVEQWAKLYGIKP